ncbi:hypothetical protein AB0J72_38820 [Dactylosporangium sp. NPDC049742]|uniref:hypothetical protein n=1 Tax=Dactylosporangium sp. NPDC049742 TaxID=3154737 RepID=UPI003447DFB0
MAHLAELTDEGTDVIVFRAGDWALLRFGNFDWAVKRKYAVKAVNLANGFRFRDLRHIGMPSPPRPAPAPAS